MGGPVTTAFYGSEDAGGDGTAGGEHETLADGGGNDEGNRFT
jgi:hypothetical protein